MQVVLLVFLLLAPSARAGEVAVAEPSFPAAFAGAARSGLGQDPFYASALLNAVQADVGGAASLSSPAEVKSYLENAAGAADAAGMESLKASLKGGSLAPRRAAAVLTAAALAQPELFAQTLDSLESLKPGFGRAAAEIFAKADGTGSPSVIAALRAAGRRQPVSSNGVYGRDGRWERLFDGNFFTATLRETAPTAVRASDERYGPDAKPRGSGLLPHGSHPILLKRADGGMEALSEGDFQNRFGVRYLPTMPKEAPEALRRDHANYRAAYEGGLGKRPAILADRDYSAQIESGRGAPVYIAKVSDRIGFGAFAAGAIKAGDLIGEYTGEWRDGVPYEEALHNGFLFEYPTAGRYQVDAGKAGSLMRFVNHSAENANARAVFQFHGGYYHILYVAKRDIGLDEQILLDYGPKYWQGRGEPAPL